MRRLLAAALVAAAAAAAPAGPAHAEPGGTCDGVVDFRCRRPCVPDELDCGLVPPCQVWVGGACVVE